MRARLLKALLVSALLLAAMPAPVSAVTTPVTYTFLNQIGSMGTGLGQFPLGAAPEAAAVDSNGFVYVLGQDQNIVRKFDSSGAYRSAFGTSGPGGLNRPQSIAIDRFDRIYVTDGLNDRVAIYDTAGAFQGEVSVANPHDVAIGRNGEVYVLQGNTILRFDRSGTQIGSVTFPNLLQFNGITTDVEGNVYAAEDEPTGGLPEGNDIDKLPADLSSHNAFTSGFSRPGDVAVDPLGRVLVADTVNNKIRGFTSGFSAVATIGASGLPETTFVFPYSLAVGPFRDVFVVDTFNFRVQRFKQTAPTLRTDIEGTDRIGTGIAVSQEAYSSHADNVLIATAYNWPDALGGASLAGQLKGPILLTSGASLSSGVSAEIARLGATQAYILGGTGAVSQHVEDQLTAQLGTGHVTRLGGLNRFQTADAIAAEAVTRQGTSFGHMAFVATGWNFPDALAASPLSAANGIPLYLADANGMRPATKAAMQAAGVTQVYILGSTNAVNANVESDLKATFGPGNVGRIQGGDRYATARAIAEFGMASGGMNAANIGIATGENYPDALSAGPLLGHSYSVLLLTRKASLPGPTSAKLTAWKDRIYETRYFGSTAAVQANVRTSVADLLW